MPRDVEVEAKSNVQHFNIQNIFLSTLSSHMAWDSCKASQKVVGKILAASEPHHVQSYEVIRTDILSSQPAYRVVCSTASKIFPN